MERLLNAQLRRPRLTAASAKRPSGRRRFRTGAAGQTAQRPCRTSRRKRERRAPQRARQSAGMAPIAPCPQAAVREPSTDQPRPGGSVVRWRLGCDGAVMATRVMPPLPGRDQSMDSGPGNDTHAAPSHANTTEGAHTCATRHQTSFPRRTTTCTTWRQPPHHRWHWHLRNGCNA